MLAYNNDKIFSRSFQKISYFFHIKNFQYVPLCFYSCIYSQKKRFPPPSFKKNYMFCSPMTKNFGKIYSPTYFKIFVDKKQIYIYTIKIKVDFTTISARKVFAPKGHFLFHKLTPKCSHKNQHINQNLSL